VSGPPLYTTFAQLRASGACGFSRDGKHAAGYGALSDAMGGDEAYGLEAPIPASLALERIGVQHVVWGLIRVVPGLEAERDRVSSGFAADCLGRWAVGVPGAALPLVLEAEAAVRSRSPAESDLGDRLLREAGAGAWSPARRVLYGALSVVGLRASPGLAADSAHRHGLHVASGTLQAAAAVEAQLAEAAWQKDQLMKYLKGEL
jgi:hypothetical protein